MKTSNCSGLFICAGVLALALLSGCGGSTTATTTIPDVATIFFSHSVVLDGTDVKTAGYNAFGQLGNSNLATQTTFQKVQNMDPIVQVAAGGEHTLALAINNPSSIYSWGYDAFGQLGRAPAAIATTGSGAFSSTPVQITLPHRVIGIAAGAFHSLAIVDDSNTSTTVGTVYSWGSNGNGQLGNASNLPVSSNLPTPVLLPIQLAGELPGEGGVKQVAAGSSHSLALTATGDVYAWGNNANGQSAALSISSSVAVSQVFGLSNVSQIAAGGSTSYALDTSHRLWAWGYNGMGQLGADPAILPYSPTPRQITIGGSGVITKISAGRDHLLILVDDGTVWALGFNESSQLGDNTIASKFVAVQVKGPTLGTLMTGVTDIIAFGHQSMALSNGTWFGWGDNSYGQLGAPISTTTIGYLMTPVKSQGLGL